jgi:uncharacterized hydrophobic protein (TIGR00271 family)
MILTILKNFRLKNEREDYSVIHEVIEKGIIFKGTNLWILIFAIFIASVGLNVNSTAVIIGAMLVSPLMGPILGIGYSVASYDFILLRKSISNFTFAVIVSLITSTVYFLITPLNEAHSELLARTSPSIYDVLIAFFGGLAGIVAISSKVKGNVIPGVAIATALMPPLCTAGFGLATAQWSFFFGAFYLFTINTVFIALATFITSRFIKIPIIEQSTERNKIKANRWVTTIVLITLLPSIYFGYQLIKEDTFVRNSKNFINNITMIDGGYLLKNEIDYSKKQIKLIYGGKTLTSEQKELISLKTRDFNLFDATVVFQQGFAFNQDNKDLETNQLLRNEIYFFKSKLDSLQKVNFKGKEIFNEIKHLFPQVSACLYSQSLLFNKSSQKLTDVVVFYANNITLQEKEKIYNWLEAKLNSDNILLIIEPARNKQ